MDEYLFFLTISSKFNAKQPSGWKKKIAFLFCMLFFLLWLQGSSLSVDIRRYPKSTLKTSPFPNWISWTQFYRMQFKAVLYTDMAYFQKYCKMINIPIFCFFFSASTRICIRWPEDIWPSTNRSSFSGTSHGSASATGPYLQIYAVCRSCLSGKNTSAVVRKFLPKTSEARNEDPGLSTSGGEDNDFAAIAGL